MPATASRPVPAQAGIGLRSAHHDEFLHRRPAIPWVEVHSENFFADGGRQLQVLDAVRRDYGLSLHGVGLSLGGVDPLDPDHLRRLKRLVQRAEPVLVSEHVCWSSADGIFLNDLLPLPYTEAALSHTAARVAAVQDYLGRQILVENVSSYLQFEGAEMTEWDFLVQLAQRAGCRILLDVNNIYVSAVNHGFQAQDYLRAIPAELVGEVHLAGHTVADDILIDTHSAPVADAVWALYRDARRLLGPVPTLIEWDADLPALDRLLAEAARADAEALVAHEQNGADRAA
ncbi:MAG: DUF692 domain-containing protein [Chromatiales bacterium]|nr:DUF692 domain-containing protein [Chromatiales bacterium]